MDDPFKIVEPEFDNPPRFNDALIELLGKVEGAVQRYEALAARIPEERYAEEEWSIVERAGQDVEEAVERADEGFIAVQYDSHAWYRIMESLEQIRLRLESAIGIMERVREREPVSE